MLEHVAFRMELRRLLDSGERFDLRQDRLEQAGIVHDPHGAAGVRAGEDADEFVADALGADLARVRRHADHGRVGLLLDGVIEPRREPHRAQQPQLVLRETLLGISDRADHAVADVFLALDPVHHASLDRIVEHAVDREVAPGDILARRAEPHAVRVAAVGRGRVRPESRDLETALAGEHHHHAELRADRQASRKKPDDLFGARARGDVVVVRLDSHYHVADAAAREVRLMARGAKRLDDPLGIRAKRFSQMASPFSRCIIHGLAGRTPCFERHRWKA